MQSTDTVTMLLKKLAAKGEAEEHDQLRLTFSGKPVAVVERTLESYDIADECTVHVLKRLRGGGVSKGHLKENAQRLSILARLHQHDEQQTHPMYAEFTEELAAINQLDETACDYFSVYVIDLEGVVHTIKDMTAHDTVGSLKTVIQIQAQLNVDMTFGLNFLGEPLNYDKAYLCKLNVMGKGLVMTA